jgi:hypothetical protein
LYCAKKPIGCISIRQLAGDIAAIAAIAAALQLARQRYFKTLPYQWQFEWLIPVRRTSGGGIDIRLGAILNFGADAAHGFWV